jgi:hypothetical protein
MDIFNQIDFNKHNQANDYSNFGEDMYGTNVKIPVHSYRSLYSKQPIYFTDYGSGGGGGGYPAGYGRRWWKQPYYAKPPSGGIWAMDGVADKDSWVADCVKNKLSAIPAGTNFIIDPAIGAKIECGKAWDDKNAQSLSSAKTSLSNNAPIIVGAIVGAVAGYFVAKSEKVSLIGGVLIGGGAIAGVMMLLNPSEK